jgi:hypothetical protein
MGKPVRTLEYQTPDAGPILVLEFVNVPVRNSLTLLTAGLSEVLSPPDGNELAFTFYDRDCDDEVRALVVTLANVLAETGRRYDARLDYGSILGPRGPVLPRTTMTTLVAMPLMFHDPRVAEFHLPQGNLRVCWLVPLYESEGQWLETHGYAEFTTRLWKLDPDVLDLQRPPMDLANTTLTHWDRLRLRWSRF